MNEQERVDFRGVEESLKEVIIHLDERVIANYSGERGIAANINNKCCMLGKSLRVILATVKKHLADEPNQTKLKLPTGDTEKNELGDEKPAQEDLSKVEEETDLDGEINLFDLDSETPNVEDDLKEPTTPKKRKRRTKAEIENDKLAGKK